MLESILWGLLYLGLGIFTAFYVAYVRLFRKDVTFCEAAIVTKDYISFTLRTTILDYLDVGQAVSDGHKMTVSYYRADDKYTIVIPTKKGVKPISKFTIAPIVEIESLEPKLPIAETLALLEYAGPNRDFHNIPVSPRLLGIKNPIIVTYSNGIVKEYIDNQIIDVSLPVINTEGYSFFPIYRPQLIKYYEKQKKIHWVPGDIDMSQERQDFDDQPLDIQEFVEGIIAFFVPTDGKVNENIFEYFQKDTSFWKEARVFYAAQADMETTHSKMYSLMAQVLIRDPTKLNAIYNAENSYPSVKRIFGFMNKYMDRSYTLAERIIAFACIEGILFNSAFAAVYWLKKRNILRGFCKANEFIARDEKLHTKFAVAFYLLASKEEKIVPAAKPRAYEIVSEAVSVNELYIKDILKADKIGMSSLQLIDYTKCTADTLLVSLGHEKLYNVVNPFDWMAIISLPNKTNFFEDKVSEYSQQIESDFIFDENADF